jgi:hypothetical protein
MEGVIFALAVSLALVGCAAKPRSTAQPRSENGPIAMSPDDAKALVGTWEGTFVLDNGYKGDTTLHVVSAVHGSVEVYYEFRWDHSGYDRYPDGENTLTGYITDRGHLRIGEWDLWLAYKDGSYTFTGEEVLGDRPGKLWYWRTDIVGL